jgi:peroxin-1
MSPDVNLRTLAKDSTGFSGADLQALVYNAHLEVVHSSISDAKSLKDHDKKDSIVNGKGAGGKGVGGTGGYRQIAPSDIGEKGISSAARSEMEKRVSFEPMITRVRQADE